MGLKVKGQRPQVDPAAPLLVEAPVFSEPGPSLPPAVTSLPPTSAFECLLRECWRRQWQPTPVLLPGNPMDRGAWEAAVHEVAEGRTRLSDVTLTFHFPALEKETATHSSVLA